MHLLATFAAYPEGVVFDGQEGGEKIILFLRPHVVTLIPPLLITIFLILVPFLVPAFLDLLNIDLANSLNAAQTFLLTVFWYLVVAGYAFYKFIFWYFNVYLLTNERIVDFDFRGILQKEISYAELPQIEDVSPKIIGFFGTFFNYGNVFVQTAGTNPEFEFINVARPDLVAQEILKQVRLEEAPGPGKG